MQRNVYVFKHTGFLTKRNHYFFAEEESDFFSFAWQYSSRTLTLHCCRTTHCCHKSGIEFTIKNVLVRWSFIGTLSNTSSFSRGKRAALFTFFCSYQSTKMRWVCETEPSYRLRPHVFDRWQTCQTRHSWNLLVVPNPFTSRPWPLSHFLLPLRYASSLFPLRTSLSKPLFLRFVTIFTLSSLANSRGANFLRYDTKSKELTRR